MTSARRRTNNASLHHACEGGLRCVAQIKGTKLENNYVTRDNFGMYANSASGQGAELMGADTLLGNDV